MVEDDGSGYVLECDLCNEDLKCPFYKSDDGYAICADCFKKFDEIKE